jgi:uncharacterized membrane protein required for colicin V production
VAASLLGGMIDGGIVAFLILQTFLGWRRGLLWQAAGVASIAFGVLLGLLLTPMFSEFLTRNITSDSFRAKLIGFIFIVGCVGVLLRLAAAWAEVQSESGLQKKQKEVRRAHDRVLGGIFGAVKGSVLALLLIAAAVTFSPQSRVWRHSSLAEPMAIAGSRLLPDGAVIEVKRWVARSSSASASSDSVTIR